ncbi:MAG: hypothetical protein RLZZ570_55 [Bacteroidota bacterium]
MPVRGLRKRGAPFCFFTFILRHFPRRGARPPCNFHATVCGQYRVPTRPLDQGGGRRLRIVDAPLEHLSAQLTQGRFQAVVKNLKCHESARKPLGANHVVKPSVPPKFARAHLKRGKLVGRKHPALQGFSGGHALFQASLGRGAVPKKTKLRAEKGPKHDG